MSGTGQELLENPDIKAALNELQKHRAHGFLILRHH